MHPRLTEELLEQEVEAVRANDFLLARIDGIERRTSRILVRCSPAGSAGTVLCFSGPRYDTYPMGLSVLDPGTGEPLPGPGWPGGLYFGSDHPVLHRPFSCLRGLEEYHLHPSHLADRWDGLRFELRFPTILSHVLSKAGVP